VSEQLEQPKKKKLTPPEVYRMAAEIYEKLPEGQKLEVIEALCNMVGRTAVGKKFFVARSLGIQLGDKWLPYLLPYSGFPGG